VFWHKKRPAHDFREEIRAHLQLDADELQSAGLADAESAARKAFGNVTAAEERFYERRRLVWLDHLLQDIRYGLRAMRINPGFTLAVVFTLALGMGANTAIFSLIDAVLLRSLPVKDPASLYFMSNAGARGVGFAPPYPCFERFRALSHSFSGIAAYRDNDFSIRIDGPLEQIDGAVVTGNYYNLLGVTPFAGRLFTDRDDKLDPLVAVISYGYWQRRFGASPAALGKTFSLEGSLNGRKFTIIGITPPDFHGLTPGRHDDVTMPMAIAEHVLQSNNSWFFQSVGRLRSGITPARARAEIDPIFQAFMNQYPQPPDARRDFYNHMELRPASRGLDELRKRFSRPLWALMAVVALVLLIACANITNLLLARAAKREREFAVRVAIGAGRSRLFRQVLVETGLLFAAGALAGVAVAWWGTRAMLSFFAGGAHPILLEVQWDWRLLSFTAGLSLLATLIFGAAPLLRALRADPHAAMKNGVRTTQSRGTIDLGRFLVVFQVTLSLVLLVGAALFLQTLRNLYSSAAGFDAGGVALMTIHLPDSAYHEQSARIALWDRMLPAMRSLPGVQSVSLSRMTPLDGSDRGVGFEVSGSPVRLDQDRNIAMNTVSEDYFKTMGTALLSGRAFTAQDRSGAPDVVLLNESAVQRFFASRNPIGALVKLMGVRSCRVVGVVRDAKQANLREEAGPFVYIPLRQPLDMGAFMTLSLRTSNDPRSLIVAASRRAHSLGSEIGILRPETLSQQLDESLLQERLIFTLAMAFGALALLLSAIGLYGVLAYSLARRTSEIGIRMTLGALPGQVAWSILRETLALVFIGLAAGIPASILLAREAQKLLYGVTPSNAIAQAGSAVLLTLVACLASYLPARRAGRIDPVAALRSE
jgi:predicted permease